jgi:hypothetical protein
MGAVALYKQAFSMGDYSCRYSSGLSPDSLASSDYSHLIANSRCKVMNIL